MMREVCDKYGVLLVLDEVMCGMWRMGSLFAYTELCEGVTVSLRSLLGRVSFPLLLFSSLSH